MKHSSSPRRCLQITLEVAVLEQVRIEDMDSDTQFENMKNREKSKNVSSAADMAY